jgi:hypothetical protein
MLFVRFYEQAALAGVLDGSGKKGQDYATLLSVDKDAELNKNNVEESKDATATDAAKTKTKATTSSTDIAQAPLTVSPNGSTSSSPSTSEGNISAPTTGGGGSTEPTPIQATPTSDPFKANVEGINLISTTIECDTTVTSSYKCHKVYTFKGEIKSFNGPGQIVYGWQSSQASFNEEGSYSAGSGETFTVINKTIKIDCSQPAQISMSLALRSPNLDSSDPIFINHECGTQPR